MKRIKIAQIGIGHDHSAMIYNSLVKQTDIFDVQGFFAVPGEEKYIKQKYDVFGNARQLRIEDIINNNDIEAVVIETEEENLTKYALIAANGGKHIHMDKPGGTELCDYEKLIDLVKLKKLQFHTGYMYRYNPELVKLKESIKRGEIGEVFSVEAQMSPIFPSTTEKRQWLSKFKGGMMFFLGCHLIDVIVDIMGEPDNIVPFIKRTRIDGTTSEDFCMSVFEYKNAVSFAKCCAAEVAGGGRRQIVVCGTKKTVEIKPIEIYGVDSADKVFTDVAYYQDNAWVPDAKIRSEGFDRYDNMMSSFAAMVRGEKINPWTYDYELMLYKCILRSCGR